MSQNDTSQLGCLLGNSHRYEIPQFQRNYSWKKDQIIEFWNDALTVYSDKIDEYFFGPIVLVEKEKNQFLIVDGQQRMTTVSILAAIIRDMIKTKDVENASQIENYLFVRKMGSDEKRHKLKLNNINRGYYEEFIIRYESPDEKLSRDPNSNDEKKIYDAYEILYKKLKDRFPDQNSITLVKFFQEILDRFSMVKITVNSLQKAYRIFATLNQRGLDLTISDLVKNYILERSHNADNSYERWNEITQLLGDHLNVFLRHFWMAHHGYITTQKLYNAITEEITNGDDVNVFLTNLTRDSHVYDSLINPGGKWNGRTTSYLLELFDALKNDSAHPLFIKAIEQQCSEEIIEELSKICRNLHFRGKTVGDKTANEMVRTMVKAACEIRQNNLTVVKGILQEISVPDSEFKSSFKQKDFGPHIAKYVLEKIEKYVDKQSMMSVKNASLEHILPQTLNAGYWTNNFTKIQHKNYLNKIANLTLLHSNTNSQLQNEDFNIKCEEYKNENNCQITRNLCKYEIWNSVALEERSKYLSGQAKEIWQELE